MTEPSHVDAPVKRRISPFLTIVGVIVLVAAMIMLMPSSKSVRLKKAQDLLNVTFKKVGPEYLVPLYGVQLVSRNGLATVSESESYAVIVFAPDGKNTNTAVLINEICSPTAYLDANSGKIHSAALLAPDPSSTGWTLMAKVWFAQALVKKPTATIQALGVQLVSLGRSSVYELNEIWKKVPKNIQDQATAMLERNREVATKFSRNTRIFHHKLGPSYVIDGVTTYSDFMWDFFEAYPECKPKPD